MADTKTTDTKTVPWTERIRDLASDAWWASVTVERLEARAGQPRFRLSDKSVTSYSMLTSRAAANVTNVGIVLKASVEKAAAAAGFISAMRLVIQPLPAQPELIWDMCFDSFSGRYLPPHNEYGAYGTVNDEGDAWRVTLVAFVQAGGHANVNMHILPAVGKAFRSYDQTATGTIIVRNVEFQQVPVNEAHALCQQFPNMTSK
jgi:hypothetical protein